MEAIEYLKFIMALVFVLGLIGGCSWIGKRFGLVPRLARGGTGDARLRIVDQVSLDQKRRLVIVRRDGVEHLLLLGADNDIVVESGFPAPAPIENAEDCETDEVSTDPVSTYSPGDQVPIGTRATQMRIGDVVSLLARRSA